MELFVLFLVALPFIVSFTRLSRLTRRMNDAEALLEEQRRDIERIGKELRDARRESVAPPPVKAAEPMPAPEPAKPAAPPPPKPAAPPAPPAPVSAQPADRPAPTRPAAPPSSPPPPPPAPPAPAFEILRIDWEQLIGVRMFSAVAGVALVLAAVFFLRYSIDHGWLAPPVRVAIGLVTAIAGLP